MLGRAALFDALVRDAVNAAQASNTQEVRGPLGCAVSADKHPPVHLHQQAPHLLQCPAIDRAMLRRRRRATVTALLAATATASSEWGEWGPPPPPPPPPPQAPPQQPYYGEQPQQPYDQQQPQRPPGPPPPKPPAGPTLARVSSVVSGAGVGCGIGKCITGNASPRFAAAGAVSCFLSCCVGGRFGDAALALGQTTVGAVKKSRALRDGRYPVFRQFKAGLGLVQREPWPPGAPNPWRYKRQSAIDPRFSMYEALGAALLTGGVGINFVPLPPLVPRSLCALGASLFFMSLVVVRDARGDAARCLAARVVASIRVMLAAASEQQLVSKTAQAWGLGAMRLGAVDKKLGVSRTMGRLFSRAASTAQAAAAEAAAAQPGGPDRRPPPPPQQQQPAWAPDSQSDWGHPGAAGPGAGQW